APAAQQADFAEKYDWWTLIYGAVWRPEQGAVVLVCPKLMNLEAVLRRGRFRGAGGTLPLRRIRRFRRYDEIWLEAERAPGRLTFGGEGLEFDCAVSDPDPSFDGLACLVTLSQDNELEWIADWVGHHVRHQGIEAVL